MENQVISNPLWDLMLSNNDCYPGCGCDRDFFDLNAWRVNLWAKQAGKEKLDQALIQVETLISKTIDLEGLTQQTNFCFYSPGEAIAWFLEWQILIKKAIQANIPNKSPKSSQLRF